MTEAIESVEFVPSNREIQADIPAEGLLHVVAQSPTLPFPQLDPRHFETLVYLILRRGAGPHATYDQVSLLPVGADSGRDILLRRGQVSGIVQCKRKSSRMTRKEILTEILRHCLYAVRDPSLRPAPGTRYELWTAYDISSQARELIEAEDVPTLMREELPALVKRARNAIVSLESSGNPAIDRLEVAQAIEIAAGLSLEHVGPQAIADRLSDLPEVRRQFFRCPQDGPSTPTSTEVDRLVAMLREEHLDLRRQSERSMKERYVPRAELESAFDEFMDDPKRVFVVTGGSGQGKTSWTLRLLSTAAWRPSTIVIPADQISRTDATPVDTIARRLKARPLGAIPPELMEQALWRWFDGGNRLLIVDGLDRALSDVREALPSWINQAERLTRITPTKLVLTSRPEAWSTMVGIAPALSSSLFTPEGGTQGSSVDLSALSRDEAEGLYRAYGVSPHQHRGARLTTPSLIALFAGMRERAESVVTRLDILTQVATDIRADLRGSGHGPLVAESTLDWLGDALLETPGGWITVGADAVVNQALDRLIASDHIALRDGRLRLEMDDIAELLLARRLSVQEIARRLDEGRNDPIFIGAASLVVAALEETGRADDALAALLDSAPRGLSGRLDAASRAILELRTPLAVRKRIEQAIALWNDENLVLLLSGLGTLLTQVDIPKGDLLELITPLMTREDADDWRDKYWHGLQRGRMVTPLGVAAERTAECEPEALLPKFVALSRENDQVLRSIGRTLIFRAATSSPTAILQKAWEAIEEMPSRS